MGPQGGGCAVTAGKPRRSTVHTVPASPHPETRPEFEPLFLAQRKKLWGLAYRLTGSASDADDIVQESFVRLLASPPKDAGARLAPWLVRVATNLGIDALRRRKRYTGPWLPAPVPASEDDPLASFASEAPDSECRYGQLESVTTAFLLALEALGPRQRAALLLRDVLGYTPEEAATALATTPGNIRILHLRARRALEAYDTARCIPDAKLFARHEAALGKLLAALLGDDARALEALLAEGVRTVTDAAGEFTALPALMTGRARVARFYLQATRNRAAGGPTVELRVLNGLPAAVIRLAHPVRRQAPLTVMQVAVGEGGEVVGIWAVLASGKLAGIGGTGTATP